MFISPSEIEMMTLAEIVTAYCGYFEQEERRNKLFAEKVRWLAFITWNAGMKKPVNNPQKLMKFPWDNEEIKPINPDVEFPDTI